MQSLLFSTQTSDDDDNGNATMTCLCVSIIRFVGRKKGSKHVINDIRRTRNVERERDTDIRIGLWAPLGMHTNQQAHDGDGTCHTRRAQNRSLCTLSFTYASRRARRPFISISRVTRDAHMVTRATRAPALVCCCVYIRVRRARPRALDDAE